MYEGAVAFVYQPVPSYGQAFAQPSSLNAVFARHALMCTGRLLSLVLPAISGGREYTQCE